MMPVVCAESVPKPSMPKLSQLANNRTVKTLKKLETSRVARYKKAGHQLGAVFKQADREARALFGDDITEIAKTLTSLVQPEEEEAGDASSE